MGRSMAWSYGYEAAGNDRNINHMCRCVIIDLLSCAAAPSATAYLRPTELPIEALLYQSIRTYPTEHESMYFGQQNSALSQNVCEAA
jgi:hypothetical protein